MNIYHYLEPHTKNNRYLNKYIALIEWAQARESAGTTEKHHILPKSLFEDKLSDKNNIVELPVRVHYLAHLLLHKAIGGKMSQAFYMMSHRLKRKNSRHYQEAREYVSARMRTNNPTHDLFKSNNPNADGKQAKEAWKNNNSRRKAQSRLMSELNRKHKTKPKETRYYNCDWCGGNLSREEFKHKEARPRYYCDAKCRNRHTAVRWSGDLGKKASPDPW